MLRPKMKQAGFTVVEMAVVVAIIGVIAALIIVSYSGSQRRAAETVLQSDLINASAQLESDNNFGNKYPDTAAAADGSKGLEKSDGTIFEYSYTPASNSYCLSARSTQREVSGFHITSSDTATKPGVCTGHIAP